MKKTAASIVALIVGVLGIITLAAFQGPQPTSPVAFQLRTIYGTGTPGSNNVLCSPGNNDRRLYMNAADLSSYWCSNRSGTYQWEVLPGSSGTFTSLTGDATSGSTGGATTVVGLNGVNLASLVTGLLKITTGTGVPSIATAGTDYLAPGGALGTPSSGTITNLSGTCASCTVGNATAATTATTAANATLAGGLAPTGAGAAIPTGPSSSTSNDLVCYTGTAGKQADCGTLAQGNILSSTAAVVLGVTSQLASSTGNAQFQLNEGAATASAYTNLLVAGTGEWRYGLIGSTNFVLRDQVGAGTPRIIDLPVNTMPANSITGNAAGAVLLTVQTPAARKGTFVCTAAGTITIANTLETATSDVPISLNTAGGTITTAPAMKTVTAGTGFTVLCGASDTSTYNYNILN